MKVQVQQEKVQGFVPFTLTIKFDTLEEAAAIRAVHGGMTKTIAMALVENTYYLKASEAAVESAVSKIGTEVQYELSRQGLM